MRTCPRCHEKKPVDDFYKSKETGNPIGYCRSCRSKSASESRRRNWDNYLTRERERRSIDREMLNSQARTSQAKRRGLITQFPIEKQCRMCLVVKPVSEFNRDSYKRDGLTRYCKPCQVAATAQWQKNNRTRNAEHGWKSRLKRKYGMTPEDYDALLKSQGSMCAICRTKEPGGKTGWHIDHCHKTDKVRGMLCGRCNRSIGAFEDDAELLQRAVDYLLKAA